MYHIILVSDVVHFDNGGGYACVGGGGVWEIFVPFSQYGYKTKLI